MNLYKAPPEPHTQAVTSDGFALLDQAYQQRRAYQEEVHRLVNALPRVPVDTPYGRESWRLLSYTSREVTLARDGHTVLYGKPVRFKRDTRYSIGQTPALRVGLVNHLIRNIQRGRK